MLAVCSPRPSSYLAVNKKNEINSRFIIEDCEIVLQWIPSYCGILSIDTVDTISKNASHLPSAEERTAGQQAVAEITRKSVHLLLGVHNNNKRHALPGRQYWWVNFQLLYLEVSSLLIFASLLDMAACSDTWTGLEWWTPDVTSVRRRWRNWLWAHPEMSRVWQITWKMPTIGTDSRNYQIYIGLQERKWETLFNSRRIKNIVRSTWRLSEYHHGSYDINLTPI